MSVVSPPVPLRPATWRDIPAMLAVERAAFPDEPWDEAALWSELASRPRRAYVVAAREGHDGLEGYAGLDLAGDVADVMTLAVHPGSRGRGLGALLLGRLHDLAREAGATGVLLEVRSGNEVARRLYAARGYQLVRTRERYYRSGEDALVLRKELLP
ncbi:ribosomal-protein-alanine acetyltransferase [Serinicoccus chungangensis]|uniref:Ribosomal-protein-alanine acetyltransferase n=1 Tax=Serinicoccus chungangensis TaxID=767452 RepID=A0A0W8IH66_9MICO|nr:ribosomal protein S18-alanine N-acetyltransferase [Serinicoccus chungangensis]KUG59359.1 ribosomal-protein-alanine acetyltransferase [Serinicoccus chungangensis]